MGERGERATGARAGNRQLPATGADAGLVGLAGMGLLMAGFGLRLRLPGG
jgi:LPXTG-motif cell wall-anchored protein